MSKTMPDESTQSNGMWGLFLTIVTWGMGKNLTPTAFMTAWMAVTSRLMQIFVAAQSANFGEFEEHLHTCLTTLGHSAVGIHLRQASADQPDRITIDGVLHRAVTTSTLHARTPYGTVSVPQKRYLPVGTTSRDKILSVGGLEARLGLVEKTTPRYAKAVLAAYAELPGRRTYELLEAVGMGALKPATFRRKAAALTTQLNATLDSHLDTARNENKAPVGVHHAVLSLDRVRLPMHELKPVQDDGSPPTYEPKTLRYRQRVERIRTPPPPFKVVGKMVFVACATLMDAHGQVVSTFRYSCGADQPVAGLVAHLYKDLQWVRRSNPNLPAVVVQDGEPFLWSAMNTVFDSVPNITKCMDFYHFWQNVNPKLAVLCENNPDELSALKSQCLHHTHADLHLLKYLDRWTHLGPNKEKKDALVGLRTYFKQRGGLFNYKALRQRDLTIGSGSVESTAKQIGIARLRRAGQRWKEINAHTILRLRALFESRSHKDTSCDTHNRFQQVMHLWLTSVRKEITPALAAG